MSSLSAEYVKNVKQMFLAGVDAVKPHTIFRQNKCLNIYQNKLQMNVGDQKDEFDISDKKIHMIGFGKAVLGLAIEVENVLKQRLVSGIISVPHGSATILQEKINATRLQDNVLQISGKLRIYEGAKNNLPDKNSFNTSKDILKLCQSMTDDDILVCLVSGGGSALLTYPKPPITLNEKSNLIKALSRKGATINEMNAVRIALSMVKGGRLAEAAKNASQIVTLIISDIINDPLDLIASGPTVIPSNANIDPLSVLKKYDVINDISNDTLETIEKYSPVNSLKNVKNYIIANNQISIKAAMDEAERLGYKTVCLSNSVNGDVNDVVEIYKALTNTLLTKSYTTYLNSLDGRMSYSNNFIECLKNCLIEAEQRSTSFKGVLIVSGGEPTVNVTGKGLGGRNQELALKFTEFCTQNAIKNVLLLSAGTDGIDGPTNAAGSIGGYIQRQYALDLIKFHLKNNDSYNFYKNYAPNYHVITGHTGTNVMDLQILLYTPFKNKSSL